jgi:CheY-like chemotaxis protein
MKRPPDGRARVYPYLSWGGEESHQFAADGRRQALTARVAARPRAIVCDSRMPYSAVDPYLCTALAPIFGASMPDVDAALVQRRHKPGVIGCSGQARRGHRRSRAFKLADQRMF